MIVEKQLNITENFISTLDDLLLFLKKVENFSMCPGGPRTVFYKDVHPACAYRDITYRWRHNLCELIIENGEVCKHCCKLERTLRWHMDAKTKRKNPCKRRSFLYSPTTKKVQEIKSKALKIQRQKVSRLQKQLDKLKTELKSSVEEMKKITEENLKNDLLKYRDKLPRNQVVH